MAELVDAKDSKSFDGNIMRVRFSLWAQNKRSIFVPRERANCFARVENRTAESCFASLRNRRAGVQTEAW